jgi:uncharacterized protein
MSEKNVELMRALYDAFARDDMAFILEGCDPDIEIVEGTMMPGARTYQGHQGLLDAIDNWAGQWDDFSVELERITDAGDRVVSLTHHRGRGKVSGAPVELHVAYVHTIKGGKVIRWQIFATWGEALEAAGLRE